MKTPSYKAKDEDELLELIDKDPNKFEGWEKVNNMNNQIVIAMDMEIENGLDLIEKTIEHEGIYGYKIGSLWLLEELILPEEKGKLFKELKSILKDAHSNQKIILDMQKWGTDIPDIIKKQVNKVAPYVDELICCPMGAGRQSLKAFANACFDNKIEPICVLEMTHPESDSYLVSKSWEMILHDACDYGITRIVIPATKEPKEEYTRILNNWYPNGYEGTVHFYATGFKTQGGQTEPMVKFGVSKFIVGRAVYEAKDPIKAIEDIYKEINNS